MKVPLSSLAILSLATLLAGCSAVPRAVNTTKASISGVTNAIVFWDNESDKDSDLSELETRKKEPKQKIVGTVRFSSNGLALIYTPTKVPIAPGTLVTVLGKDGKPQDVQMKISDERRETFLVADIISGTPTQGQLVVTQPTASSPTASTDNDSYQVLP